jgi:hypothetical protein
LLIKEEQKKHQNIWALCETLVIALQFDTGKVKLLVDTIPEIAARNRLPIKEAALKLFGRMKRYGKIYEIESVIRTLGQKIYQSEQRLERSNQFSQHKDQTVRCKGVPDAHILYLPNSFVKL